MPMTTPMTADSSGRPAASSDVSVMARTRKPTAMPMASAAECDSVLTTPPPHSTCRPAASAGAALASSWSLDSRLEVGRRDGIAHVGEADRAVGRDRAGRVRVDDADDLGAGAGLLDARP